MSGVGRIDGQFVINPTQEQLKVSTLNITVAGSETAILMVEGGATGGAGRRCP